MDVNLYMEENEDLALSITYLKESLLNISVLGIIHYKSLRCEFYMY